MSGDIRLRGQQALKDRYRIDQEIGHGGMAVVFRATAVRDGTPVAIKFLLPTVATHLGTSRFLREMELVSALAHPNILTIRETGEADGLLYYVMPLINGPSVRDRIAPRIESVDESLDIAAQVADAMSHAHARNIIHRDIKPENLLTEGPRVLVADFGVGKALDVSGGTSLTTTGFVVGTPAYMSPEQAAGDADLDGRSDIYSLGLVLYEMLTGAPAFEGDTPHELMSARFIVTPAPVRDLRNDIPKPVARLIARLLAVSPADRYADAGELAAELRQLGAARSR